MAYHRFLLRVGGQLPDEYIVMARQWLAEHWVLGVARTLAFAAHTENLAITRSEARLLTDTLSSAGESTRLVDALPRATRDQRLPYLLVGSAELRGWNETGRGHVQQAAVAGAESTEGVAGLWRAWRVGLLAGHEVAPKRIFLLQARPDVDAVRLVSRLQESLIEAGEKHPLVEVFDQPVLLPRFSRRALVTGDLLWADRPVPALSVASTFDAVGPDGTPVFSGQRPRLVEPEQELVAHYLARGLQVVPDAGAVVDPLAPGLGAVVPTALRSDGRWIWSEAATYYLKNYGFAPDDGLLDTIRLRNYERPELDAVAEHQCRLAANSKIYGAAH